MGTKQKAIAAADAELNNAGLPTYSELLAALEKNHAHQCRSGVFQATGLAKANAELLLRASTSGPTEKELFDATGAAIEAEKAAQRTFDRADNLYSVDDPRLEKARVRLDAARKATAAAYKAEADFHEAQKVA